MYLDTHSKIDLRNSVIIFHREVGIIMRIMRNMLRVISRRERERDREREKTDHKQVQGTDQQTVAMIAYLQTKKKTQ